MRLIKVELKVACLDVYDVDGEALCRHITRQLMDENEQAEVVADSVIVKDVPIEDFDTDDVTNESIEAWQQKAREHFAELA